MKKNKTFTIVLVGMMTAIIAVLSQISIPLPSGVPVTLQTFAIALCAYVLGLKYGIITLLLYVLVGVCGMPVFTGFMGGPGKLVGLTGGFIWGFTFLIGLCGLPVSLMRKNKGSEKLALIKPWLRRTLAIGSGIIGLLICHLCGSLQYAVLTDISLGKSILLVSAPYLIKDIISVALAYMMSLALQRTFVKVGALT